MTSALLPANLVFRAFTQTGTPAPLAGGKLYFYQAGTSTPQAAYTDATGLVACANPLILDANGQGVFWLKSGLTYKINLTDASGVQQTGWPVDGVTADTSAAILTALADSSTVGNGDALVAGKRSEVGAVPFTYHQASQQRCLNVKTDFGAVGDGATDDHVAIQNGLNALVAAGGGKLYFPKGRYFLNTASIYLTDLLGNSYELYGDGANASVISYTSIGTALTVSLTASSSDAFCMRDMGLSGPGGVSPTGIGLLLAGQHDHTILDNVHFNGLATCLNLQNVYHAKFNCVRFNNYLTGVVGTSGYSANNNHFDTCFWGDGPALGTGGGVPINSAYMGYNTYTACTFESRGYIKGCDLRNGAGYDTFIGCRWEQNNNGAYPWLILGNHQQFLNCCMWPSGTQNFIAGNGVTNYLIECGLDSNSGFGNRIDALSVDTQFSPFLLRMSATSANNRIRLQDALPNDTFYPNNAQGGCYGIIKDLGSYNIIEMPGGAVTQNRVNSYGSGRTLNMWLDNLGMSTITTDGLVKGTGPGDGTPAGRGPHEDNYVFTFGTPTGNQRAYFAYGNGSTIFPSAGYIYVFSVWMMPKVAGEVVQIFCGQNMADANILKTVTLSTPGIWERVWISAKATVGGSGQYIYAGFKLSGASTGIYVSQPQLEENSTTSLKWGPSGIVRTTTISGAQNFGQSSNPAPVSNTRFGTGSPSTGYWNQGDQVWNINAAASGVPGWVCTVSGNPGTWKNMAALSA